MDLNVAKVKLSSPVGEVVEVAGTANLVPKILAVRWAV